MRFLYARCLSNVTGFLALFEEFATRRVSHPKDIVNALGGV